MDIQLPVQSVPITTKVGCEFKSRSVVFSGTTVSFTNKTVYHDITEILLKVALNTINQTLNFHGFVKETMSINIFVIMIKCLF